MQMKLSGLVTSLKTIYETLQTFKDSTKQYFPPSGGDFSLFIIHHASEEHSWKKKKKNLPQHV